MTGHRVWHATLMEVMIALTLTAILLTCILGAYYQTTRLSKEVQTTRAALMEREELYLRLRSTLEATTIGGGTPQTSSHYYFYTEAGALIFTYDSPINLDPLFSSDLLARLSVDEQQQLCLERWPLPKEKGDTHPSYQKQVLLTQVSGLTISSYNPPPQANEKALDSTFKGPSVGWQSAWEIDYNLLPAMVKLTVLRLSGETIEFLFQIPEGSKPIVYPKNRGEDS